MYEAILATNSAALKEGSIVFLSKVVDLPGAASGPTTGRLELAMGRGYFSGAMLCLVVAGVSTYMIDRPIEIAARMFADGTLPMADDPWSL